MPTYDYRCEGCQHEFEYFQSMKDDLLKTCPECKEDKLKRLVGSGAGIIFKGNGDDWPSQQIKRKNDMTKKNETAGKRGEKMWRERMPKLVDQKK